MELNIQGLTKKFKDKVAVEEVSLRLTPGVWGLLGANGAGKTTLMRMIAGIMEPTGGTILYGGKEIGKMGADYRERFGFLPQEFGYGREFTVEEYLDYMAALKDLPPKETGGKIRSLLTALNLEQARKKKIYKLSGGMRRRVGIAQAMLNDPEILIMDEPTAGLDPGERVKFRNLISGFAKGRIVLISTHIVSDVEFIATETAVMKEGRIVDVGTTEQLVRQVQGKVWESLILPGELLEFGERYRVINQRSAPDGRIAVRCLAEGEKPKGAVKAEPRLEDLYLWLFPEAEKEEEG